MNVAFIPVRGGSKSIPMKNIKPLCGKPLVYWAVKAASNCKYIDKVYVATDSEKIRETVEEFKNGSDAAIFKKTIVIDRSPESASDTASTESSMLEFSDKYVFDNIVLVQATSPLLQAADLDKGFEAYQSEGTDSVLSVVRQKRFNWEIDDNGNAHPANYDVFHRPRRQEFDGYMVENGAFYITSKGRLIESKNRISGNIKAVEMDEETFFEIDEESDWEIIEALMKRRTAPDSTGIPEIKMFLTDCDGCLTDGGMYYSENGDELKKFNTRDGMGFALLRSRNIITGIVTGENLDLNTRRANKLKIEILEQDCKDKLSMIKRLCKERGVKLENVCYIGDDINDIDVIRAVGYGCSPADAIKEVREAAKYVTAATGGNGVIREVVDRIMSYK